MGELKWTCNEVVSTEWRLIEGRKYTGLAFRYSGFNCVSIARVSQDSLSSSSVMALDDGEK